MKHLIMSDCLLLWRINVKEKQKKGSECQTYDFCVVIEKEWKILASALDSISCIKFAVDGDKTARQAMIQNVLKFSLLSKILLYLFFCFCFSLSLRHSPP